MAKVKDEFYSPMLVIMLAVMISGMVGCIIFGILSQLLNIRWMSSCAITFGMFTYHILIRFLSPRLLQLVFRKKYNYKAKWFQTKLWEQKMYQLLKVKKWKAHAMAFDPREFSLQQHSPEEIINNMCHAEVVHELIVVLSFTSILFAIPFGAFWVFLITAVLAALVDCFFVMIQRYNRPRFVKVVEKKN